MSKMINVNVTDFTCQKILGKHCCKIVSSVSDALAAAGRAPAGAVKRAADAKAAGAAKVQKTA